MPRFGYSINPDTVRVTVSIYGLAGHTHKAGSAFIHSMSEVPVFESYAIETAYRGQGLSYALTYFMLLYCKDKGKTDVKVMNAHWPLNLALRGTNFTESNPRRDPTFKGAPRDLPNNTGDFLCTNLGAAMNSSRKKMVQRRLLSLDSGGFMKL